MKSIELFAGAGGLALGLEKAGFEHIGLVEIDEAAAKTLMQNRPEDTVIKELMERAEKTGIEDDNLSMAMSVYMLGFSTYNGFQ